MAWTVTVRAASSDNQGNRVVALRFDNGLGKIFDTDCHIPLGAGQTFVADFTAQTIKQLDLQNQAFQVVPATGQTVTPTADPVLSQIQINQNKFVQDWDKLQGALLLVNAGILQSNDTRIATLRSNVQTEAQQVISDSDFLTLLSLIR